VRVLRRQNESYEFQYRLQSVTGEVYDY
jgi:hypothetical protein